MTRRWTTFLTVLSLIALPMLAQETGTRINIINGDDPGEGFNDLTPKTPIGGNAGTTLGEQRLIAFQHAADLWAALLDSPVEIRVEANFNPLECTASSAVLGRAGPRFVYANFPNAPIANTWYVTALANKLAGQDLGDGEPAIEAEFNSSLNGDPNCAGGSSWYYGLDNNPGPDQTDLVVVVLHELAHGLGFLTTTDKENGTFLQGRPDVYASFLFDKTIGASWPQMTAAQRVASATNDGNLVWIGQNAIDAAPSFLAYEAVLDINSPASIAGTYPMTLASFGADAVTIGGVTANVVAALDEANASGPSTTDGCTAFTNPGEVAGRIVLVDRGDCTFVTKAINAEAAGALGVIVANNVSTGLPPMGGSDDTLTIPSIGISQADGATIRGVLDSGVQATIRRNPPALFGTDSLGRPKLYAPDPLELGSSVSHWDPSAEPNLLMEPSINSSLGHGVDLSRDLFADIGWYSEAVIESFLRDFLLVDVDRDGAADPGDTVRLVASIQNNGDVVARNAVFDLDLPAGLTVVPGSVTGGTVVNQSGRVTVELDDIAIGGEVSVVFDLRIALGLDPTVTSFRIQGAISGSNFEVAVTDDPATVETDDTTLIEISHTPLRAYKSVILVDDADANGELSAGDRLRYYVVIRNNSTSTQGGVRFVDAVDDNVDIVPGSVTIGQNGIVTGGNTPGDRSVVVQFNPIAGGSFVELGFDVDVKDEIPEGLRNISNQGTVMVGSTVAVITDNPETQDLFDPTIIQFPNPRKRSVSRP